MKLFQTKASLLAICLAAMSLGACGGSQIPNTPKCKWSGVKLKLNAAKRLNMDSNGIPLSVVMRVFQIKTASALKNADFEDIWSDPKAALGEDFLSMTELTLFPGKSETRELPSEEDAGYVAVMGIFRKQTGTAWRRWARIGSPNPVHCSVDDGPERTFEFNVKEYRIEMRDE